ncbi:ATP-binding cassette domain-containing protein [Kaustia mangrovi]|uniref:ATP-binding cassette domain-containing protein n=1 Tax=Kaustia mangrovi TaxID=2593653 RepID=A0A7S8C5L2_9HYPH|nr:oligopeptide/dipeptide ABC transporter ATP-binding protein [Kaustia mangrovi]QPC43809.1 ATP-binding cassette domain-containing protein [Kaustia mangrovi]
MSDTVLSTQGLTKTFGGGRSLFGAARPAVHAVQDVTVSARRTETLGIVGESGCGKSTLARMLVGLLKPSGGDVSLAGRELSVLAREGAKALGSTIQYVFQDPLSSLNPRKTVRQILEAPLVHILGLDRAGRAARIEELMDAVNLRPEFVDRYPHEFSGGQAQRIGIARALAADPEILVLDEPVSALDVSVQAQVLNLLSDLKAKFDLTYVFISHDLAVVEAISDRVAVMYFGRVVEEAPADTLFAAPKHPYTRLLLDSAPVVGRPLGTGAEEIAELPDPLAPPPGCAFAERCPRARDDCRAAVPPLETKAADHSAACFHPL